MAEDTMNEPLCSQCQRPCAEEDLLRREDNGEPVCPDCSGLLADEALACDYDETG